MSYPMTKTKAAIGIALLALVSLMPLDLGWRYWRLSTGGVRADATVTGATTWKTRRNQWYYVAYEFADAGGRRRAGRQRISPDLYEVLKASKPGLPIKIVYDPGRPDLNVLSLSTLKREFLWWGGSLGAIWLILGLFLFAPRKEEAGIVASVRRRMLLEREARRAPATPGRTHQGGTR